MVVNDLITILKGRCLTSESGLNREIQYVFCCDCKKVVKEKGSQDYAWVNSDVDKSSIDLALEKSMSCIIIPYDLPIDDNVVNYAISFSFPIISTAYSSYKICSKIYEAFKERT
ncbi:MAG TPA: DRTGG domain-containing protein [Clostridia bacterium]|jgi:predicted transcriptional regulator|nr:MAG: DRTGG domain protein [Firmicutes bacterium ADurb.Bin146]HOD92683.1 DRTGG domain-containing protein [Clostridia bacterium]